jgi:hypothetical protein
MEDFHARPKSVVTLAQGKQNLHEYLPDDILLDKVFVAPQPPDQLSKVAIFTVLHDDVYSLLLAVKQVVIIPHNVGMF